MQGGDKTVRIHIDESVESVAQHGRRIPFHLRSKVEAKSQELLKDDIIKKINNEPTP